MSLNSLKTNRKANGFTLIELMIVVAILSVLLTLLAGGIKKSVDNAKKRGRATEVQALQSAIMTYWHDTGKFPITTAKGKYTYTFTDDNNVVFSKLLDESQNDLKKKYLDINQMRTKDNGRIQPMKRASEPLVDYNGNYYKVTIDLTTKTATVQ
jgi:prepilin-type N-terminal cleavage/methylation domain-containing protein